MARRKRKISKPKKETFTIVVDGQTEAWYFQMLKRNEPSLRVNIEPKIPQRKRLADQYEKVRGLAEYYSKVFWIIDLDTIVKYGQIQQLQEYLQLLQRDFENVTTILNNPCLEFWFLLHFEQKAKYFPRCSACEKQLKKHLRDYQKTQKYFTRQNNDIYLRLKPLLPKALKIARKINRVPSGQIDRALCEMNLFFEDDKIKNNLAIKDID